MQNALEEFLCFLDEYARAPEGYTQFKVFFGKEDSGGMPRALMHIHEGIRTALSAIENNPALTTEAKKHAIGRIASLFRPLRVLFDAAVVRTTKVSEPEKNIYNDREMRRRIAASIGGMGMHPKRNHEK